MAETRTQNERNVAALESVLEDWDIYCADPKSLAQYLASRGVLVPSVVQREEMAEVLAYTDACHWNVRPDAFRVALERIARGEQP